MSQKELEDYLIPVSEEEFPLLMQRLLEEICAREGWPIAMLYMADAEEPSLFRYEAGSGLNNKPHLAAFRMEEGLLGQAAAERRFLQEKLPAQQLINPVLSALIELDAVYIGALPLLFQGEVQAVLVLASTTDSQPHLSTDIWKDFLPKWGAYLQSARAHRQIQALLEKTQIQNQELASREEELRQNLEELAVTQEEMRRTQNLMAERTRWQELIIDLFTMTASSTQFTPSLQRIFLAQVSRYIGAKAGAALWLRQESNLIMPIALWAPQRENFSWPETWVLNPTFLEGLVQSRRSQSVLSAELLKEAPDSLPPAWLVGPYYDVKGLRGLLLFGFQEPQPLSDTLESALRSIAIAFFSAIERIHRLSTIEIPKMLQEIAQRSKAQLTYVPQEALPAGELPWLAELAPQARSDYLNKLLERIGKGESLSDLCRPNEYLLSTMYGLCRLIWE